MFSLRRIALLVAASAFVALLSARTVIAPGRRLAATWLDPWTREEFVLVSAGQFTMGTPEHERLREPQEVAHRVALTHPFYLARHEVTEELWSRVMNANPSEFQGCPSCPVERGSFYDVQAFLDRLNGRGRPGYRLPTEAEWEFACRAGGSLPFGSSASLTSTDANIDGKYPYDAPPAIARGRTM